MSVAALEQPALVLNRHWIPIHLTTARHALMLLYQSVARAVHPEDQSLHRFQTWADLRLPDGAPCVRTVSRQIPLPEIVVLERYGQIPRRTVPFNRKNLFLRDKRGERHILVVVPHEKSVDLKAFAAVLGIKKLALASPDRLKEHLGIEPGAVSILGIVNDKRKKVEVVVDQAVWKADTWQCHPLVNTTRGSGANVGSLFSQ